MQKVLEISTKSPRIRSEAISWTCNDGDEVGAYLDLDGKLRMPKRVGSIAPYQGFYSYPTVLHALGDGWRLLSAPPEKLEDGTWNWWLVKD